MSQSYTGGCQCGKVRYEVQLDIGEVIACNCSRCGRLGLLLAFAPASQFKLLQGEKGLTTYEFNRHLIEHKFCSTCGAQSFALGKNPKTGESMAAINVRCLDGVEADQFKVRKVDGRSL
jgi:hypothetical protein